MRALNACLVCMFLLAICNVGLCDDLSYAPVRAKKRSFNVSDLPLADVKMVVESTRNTGLYLLQCHSAGYRGDPDFDYSSDFECRLSSIRHKDVYSTLLTEDPQQSRDWESRGRFFSAQLRGECALIPEFGATRHFRLRGMELTLKVTNTSFANHEGLRSLRLTVVVKPDATAQTAIAESVSLPHYSPRRCEIDKDFVGVGGRREISH